jgi:cell wall-associated NlpC family hydrolase
MCQQWGPVPQQGGGKPPVLGVFIAAALIAVLVTKTGAINHHPGVQALNQKGGGPALAGIFGGFLKDSARMLPKITRGGKPSSKAAKAARYAMAQRGDRYVWGGNGPNGWDCSGLTQAAWRHAGVKIPGTAKTQLRGLKRVRSPQRGDLIVYRSAASPSGWHVAIAVGAGQMVEARGRRYGVTQGRIRGGWHGVVRP